MGQVVPPSSDVGASGAPYFCSSGCCNMLWACHMFQSIWNLKHMLYIYEFYVYFVDAIVLCVINASLEHGLRSDLRSDCDF